MKPKETQGKRNDLGAAAKIIEGGGSVLDAVRDRPALIRNIQHLERYQSLLRNAESKLVDRSDMNVVWIYGPTGCGKSRLARELCEGPPYVLEKTAQGKQLWFDHYNGEKFLIIDELRDDWCGFSQLLRILDRYPVLIAKKGSTDSSMWTTVYVTCMHPPELVFGGNGDGQRRVDAVRQLADVNDVRQLHRRIKMRYIFDGDDGGYSEEPSPFVPVTTVAPWKRERATPQPPAPPATKIAPFGHDFAFGGYGGFQ